MSLPDIEQLLTASIGLNVASIGSSTVARAVHERSAACHLNDPEAYWELLRGSPAELQALIEAVVVPETWFFRDREAFAALVTLVREEWLQDAGHRVVTILSLPCSSGEEPYSMAMALLDGAVPAEGFRIDAIDVSARVLELADRAVYGKNSFRGQELSFRDRHFEPTPQGYRLHDAVRTQVHFERGNLFAEDFLPGVALYDVIFCRNVLIYFDRATQDRAVLVLTRLLKPNGALFVAPAETGLPSDHGFAPLRMPMAFAFRRAVPVPPAPRRLAAPPRPLPARRAVPVSPSPPSPVALTPLLPANAADDLGAAARLADQGHFAEAAARCEAHLRQHGPSGTAFYLMGLVRDAVGQHDEAGAYYRKALYLEPHHYEAQIQLALLMEKQGDVMGARVLRERARRVEQRRKA